MEPYESILAGYVMPHPPVIVPGVSPGKMLAGQSVQAIERLSAEMALLQPDTVVLISPHAPLFSDYLYCYDEASLTGDLSAFGAPRIHLTFSQDTVLLDRILSRLGNAHLAAGSLDSEQMRRNNIERKLDHGAMVPLYFLNAACSFQLVVMASANLPLPDLYAVGGHIRQAAADLGKRIVIVASGDQSHKANDASPYGTNAEGPRYDRLIVDALNSGDLVGILSIDHQLRQKAAECGYRSLVMLCGAFGKRTVRSRVLSYEAPYGIGYCVARLQNDPDQQQPIADALEESLRRLRQRDQDNRRQASVPVMIAREALERYVGRSSRPRVADFRTLTAGDPWMDSQAGVFVSLKKHGELRGCIGTTAATTGSITEEIIQNAISAGTGDPRFEPVTAAELPDLVYSVDVLAAPEPVGGEEDLDPAVYGVIVRSGLRSGLLLPDLEGVETVRDQLAIACRKAGIRPQDTYAIQRFRVTRYH